MRTSSFRASACLTCCLSSSWASRAPVRRSRCRNQIATLMSNSPQTPSATSSLTNAYHHNPNNTTSTSLVNSITSTYLTALTSIFTTLTTIFPSTTFTQDLHNLQHHHLPRLQVLSNNLQGSRSPHPFWRDFPAIHVFPYQCSPMSASDAIQRQFDIACRFQLHATSIVSVLLLDEVGLAEHSPDMPLKVCALPTSSRPIYPRKRIRPLLHTFPESLIRASVAVETGCTT